MVGSAAGAERRAVVVLVAGFAASRVVYALLGVRFDTGTLGFSWQFVDPALLETDLARSIWYLHAQPPLYNLFLGVVLKLFGPHHRPAFHAASVLAGLVLTVGLYALLRALGRATWVAVAATSFVVVSPAAVLYENWLYVEYFAAVALVLIALCVHRYAATGAVVPLAGAAGLALVVTWSRSIFHLVWLVGVAAVLVFARADGRRRAVVAGTAVTLLCAALYAKNYAIVGSASASSCVGLNAFRVTTSQLSDVERRSLVSRGELSKYALLGPFSLPDSVPEEFATEPRRDVPLLDRAKTSTGVANFNHSAYPRLCRQYEADARRAVAHEPRLAAAAVRDSTLIFLRPAHDFDIFSPANQNRSRIEGLSRWWDALFMLQVREPDIEPFRGVERSGDVGARLLEASWLVAIAYAGVILGGIPLLVVAARRRGWTSPTTAVLAFCLLTIDYVVIVGNVLEVGENNRFHLLTDPLVVVVAAVALPLATGWLRDRTGRAQGRGA